jgi:aspartyl-tRNA(Asn)/glutamyl-tRNA(Gln) amidotransferase subunit B
VKPPSTLVRVGIDGGTRLTSTSCFTTPGLPLYHKWRFRDEYQLPQDDIDWWFLTDEAFTWPFFDMLFEHCFWVRQFPKLTSKIVVQHLSSIFKNREELIEFLCAMDGDDFSEFIRECGQYEYSWKYIQETLNLFFKVKEPLTVLTLKYPFSMNSNENELEAICLKVISENQKSVDDYRKGKLNSINHLKGQVMKATKGKADPAVVNKILESKLSV